MKLLLNIFFGWAPLSAAIFGLITGNAYVILKSPRTYGFPGLRIYNRAETPGLYWFAIVIQSVFGIVCLTYLRRML